MNERNTHEEERSSLSLSHTLSLRCLSEITSRAANPRLALLNFISSEEHKPTRVKDGRCMKTNLACDRLLLPHQLLPVLVLLLLQISPLLLLPLYRNPVATIVRNDFRCSSREGGRRSDELRMQQRLPIRLDYVLRPLIR